MLFLLLYLLQKKIEGNVEPSSYSEAIISGDSNKWMTAMHDEMESLEKNGTGDLVKLPREKKPIRCKWVFKRKEGVSPNNETRYKASIAPFALCSVLLP